MKRIFILLLLNLGTILVFSQNSSTSSTQVKDELDRYPDSFEEINWGPELKAQFDKRELIYKRLNENTSEENKITLEEQKLIDELDETHADQWDIDGGGCSWYCGAGDFKISSSSELETKKGSFTYSAKNAHDLSFKTAWVEGVSGYGIGEYLTYSFPVRHPRITSIIIANGYVKSEKAFKNNSRVKTLAVYHNGTKLAILHLKDIRGTQSFKFSPIGSTRTEKYNPETKSYRNEIDTEASDWSLKFEILEVYKGDKYDDTVISEIYFDGIDVH